MKKRNLYLFFSFICLSILFGLFQNFSIPKKNALDKFIPEYRIKDYVGGIEAPTGFTDYIEEQISDTDIVFDHKSFLKKSIKDSPVYKSLKDYMDISNENLSAGTCYDANGDATVCPQNSNSAIHENEEIIKSMKFRANPGRREASVKMNTVGNINSDINYCVEDQNLSLRVRQNIGSQSNVQLKVDSKDQSGSLQWSLSW